MSRINVRVLLDSINIPPLHECGIKLEKWHRLKSYYHMLEISPKTNNAQETLDLINDKLVKVEDCHSGIEKLETPGFSYTGRMYPIQEDSIDRKEDGRIIAITKGNRIIIESDGSFIIMTRDDEQIIMSK